MWKNIRRQKKKLSGYANLQNGDLPGLIEILQERKKKKGGGGGGKK